MKLRVLGKHGPFPSAGGACSGYLVSSEDEKDNILIDCGAGVLSRLLNYVSIDKLTGIVISHFHFDHMSDIFVLKYMLQFSNLKRNIPVICPENPVDMRNALEDNFLDIMNPESVYLGNMRLTFAPTVHPMPGVSVKVQCDGQTLLYTGDTNDNADIRLFSEGADLLLADCGLPEALWSITAPHLSARLCGEIAKEARARALVLTHIRPDVSEEILLDEARINYPNAEIAEEGETYYV